VSTVLLLFLSHFAQLFELTVFAEWLFYAMAASTVFVYRRKSPDATRPYRVWVTGTSSHLRGVRRRGAGLELCWKSEGLVAWHRIDSKWVACYVADSPPAHRALTKSSSIVVYSPTLSRKAAKGWGNLDRSGPLCEGFCRPFPTQEAAIC